MTSTIDMTIDINRQVVTAEQAIIKAIGARHEADDQATLAGRELDRLAKMTGLAGAHALASAVIDGFEKDMTLDALEDARKALGLD